MHCSSVGQLQFALAQYHSGRFTLALPDVPSNSADKFEQLDLLGTSRSSCLSQCMGNRATGQQTECLRTPRNTQKNKVPK
eukprot:3964864-Amphidinium_carterae.1